jgi:hypothetical protein
MKENVLILVVIYNHKYDKNIDIIENLYCKRFSTIYHIVPFYTGDKPNVIPVYENSIYFEGYIAQAYKHFFHPEAAHYFFVADDMILNPNINETNYADFFNLTDEKSFLPDFINLYQIDSWSHAREAFAFQTTKYKIETKGELPDPEEAEKRMLQNGALSRPINQEKPLKWEALHKKRGYNLFHKENRDNLSQRVSATVLRKRYTLNYPLVGSYSDIFIVSAQTIQEFCHYCGVFAAMELFVEIAIPSALALSAKKIVTEKELLLKGKPLWTEKDLDFLLPYKKNMTTLLNNYPQEILYIHPVKLSQWDIKTDRR